MENKNQMWHTFGEAEWEKALDQELDQMSDEEIISFQPPEFRRLVAKGFLAGMRGPKKYEKNSWLNLDLKASTDILPSFQNHIRAVEKSLRDKDTGIEASEIFVAARAVMYVYLKDQERRSYHKDRIKISKHKDFTEYRHTADLIHHNDHLQDRSNNQKDWPSKPLN